MKTAKDSGHSERSWHTLPPDEVIVAFASNRETGLTREEAVTRLSGHGPNRLPQPGRPPAWLRFLLQFHNALIYILLVSAAGAFFLADRADAGVILGVAVINAVIGFIREDRGENALAAIRDRLPSSAEVLRDGRTVRIDAEALVPGDVVRVQSGDTVSADLRLLEVRNLCIDDAILTGESAPTDKSVAAVGHDAVLRDRRCMAYSGTRVTSGRGVGVVVATGVDTEIGRIRSLLSEVNAPDTPLQRQLASFGHWLTVVILLMSAGTFLFGLLVREIAWEEVLRAVVGIAVAAVPEGLPVIVTITLAVGVRRMAKHSAIIRQMPVAEALGAVTVICVDKVLPGLCGRTDRPDEEAPEAMARCHDAGIRVKIITGDHALTACAIGARLRLGDSATVLTGGEIEALNDDELARVVQSVDIFAGTSPEHRLRLVAALQRQGEIVAMTGDGVNDAPALKRADVGVAMGLKVTEAAREAAAMVLADDNFSSIVHAVEQGRTIHDNLRKALLYVLPVSLGQAGGIMIGILLGLTLPITPLQILWVNMVTAVTLGLTLAFESTEDDVMLRPPGRSSLSHGFFIWRVIFVSLLLTLGLLGVFLFEMDRGVSVESARTAAVNALVVGEIFYLFNSRYIIGSALSRRSLRGNIYMLLAVIGVAGPQWLFCYLPAMQSLFATADIDGETWRRIVAFGAALFLVVELEKWLVRVLVKRRALKPRARSHLTRYAWLSIGAAVLTIGLKAGAFHLTGSVGLLSDALESLVNLAAALMALAMLLVAARPPDASHHYGHGKAEYFSSGMEGALIIVAAIAIAMTAYDRLLHPRSLESLDVGLLISGLAALVNLIVARVLLRVGRRYRSITLEADAKHLLTDVWTSLGVIAGLAAVHFTGIQILDPIIAILVAVNILWSGGELMRRSVSGLLDATLPEEENVRIDAVLCRYRAQGVEFHDLRTRQSGAHRFMTVHVLVPGEVTVKAGHDLVEKIEADIREALGEITILTHLEPLEDPASFAHEASPRRIGNGVMPKSGQGG